MTTAILTINAGSSSIKFAVYQTVDLSILCRGQVSSIQSQKESIFEVDIMGHNNESKSLQNLNTHQQAIDAILNWIERSNLGWQLVAVGHRIVHGGIKYYESVLIDTDIINELRLLEPLAPLHQPHNVAAIISIQQYNSTLAQVACFDTAFHASQDAIQRLLPLPKKFRDKGLMKYGFHGLSYEYLIEELGKKNEGSLPDKVVIVHLGNGASACAIKAGKSVSTTMSFSTLDGLLMGSRCGAIDAGVLLYLMQSEGLTVDELSTCLYEQSGLLGLSGLSSDIRDLENSHDINAQQSLDYYIDSIVKNIAALATTLEGLDAVVFSGGVGENSSLIRQRVLTKLKWFGVEMDVNANQTHQIKITTQQSRIQVFAIKTDEELIIARKTKSKCKLD